MKDVFITDIHIREVRHLKDVHIQLSKNEMKHLILTGKNGSGKTTIIERLDHSLMAHFNWLFAWQNPQKSIGDLTKKLPKEFIITFNNFLELDKRGNEYLKNRLIYKKYDAKRTTNFIKPPGPQLIDFESQQFSFNSLGNLFVQHLVNLKFEQYKAVAEKNVDEEKRIEEWFVDFQEQLARVFEDSSTKLKFDSKKFNFLIEQDGKLPFGFDVLPDGFDAILFILADLLMVLEQKSIKPEEAIGFILIDEVEAHLHISLQKKIFSFLTDFFPNLQFIVTTHSPFVLNSVDNAVIFDLEHKKRVEDLSMYSSEGIVEAYFENDKYSDLAKTKLARYEELATSGDLSENEEDELDDLIDWLEEMPDQMAPELALHFKMLELKRTQQTY